MSRATVAKLAVVVFLAFIVCLPEFFPSEVLQVQFLCAPFDPCDPNNGHDHYDGQVYEMYNRAAIPRPQCETKNTTNQDEEVKEWFVCETHTDLRGLCDNTSISEMDLEVIVTLQIPSPRLLQNVTVNGHFNRTGVHIETQHNVTVFGCCKQNSDKMPQSGSSKRTSVPHKARTLEPAGSPDPDVTPSKGKNPSSDHNRCCCLFHFKDIQRMSSQTVRWWCVSTIVWLVLVLMVVVLVLLGVRDQVFKNRYCCRKKKILVVLPANQPNMFSKRRVKSLGDLPDDVSALSIEDTKLFLEKTPPDYSRGHALSHQRRFSLVSTKRLFHVFRESYNRGLSPIPELSVTDVSVGENEDGHNEEVRSDGVIKEEECEVCLDIPLTPANTHSESFTFLHHRSHPSVESCH